MLKNLAPDADSPIEIEPEELRACVRKVEQHCVVCDFVFFILLGTK